MIGVLSSRTAILALHLLRLAWRASKVLRSGRHAVDPAIRLAPALRGWPCRAVLCAVEMLVLVGMDGPAIGPTNGPPCA